MRYALWSLVIIWSVMIILTVKSYIKFRINLNSNRENSDSSSNTTE